MAVNQRLSLFFSGANAYHFAPLFILALFGRTGIRKANRDVGRRASPRCVWQSSASPAAQNNISRRDSNPELILLDGT
jgi:hypothetical protein